MNQQLEDYVKQARARGIADNQIREQLLGAGWNESSINQFFSQKNIVIRPGTIFEKSNLIAIAIGVMLVSIPDLINIKFNPIVIISKGINYIYDDPFSSNYVYFRFVAAEIAYNLIIGIMVAWINRAKSYSVVWLTGLLGHMVIRAVISVKIYDLKLEDLSDHLLYSTFFFFISATVGYFIVKGFFRLRRV